MTRQETSLLAHGRPPHLEEPDKKECSLSDFTSHAGNYITKKIEKVTDMHLKEVHILTDS